MFGHELRRFLATTIKRKEPETWLQLSSRSPAYQTQVLWEWRNRCACKSRKSPQMGKGEMTKEMMRKIEVVRHHAFAVNVTISRF